MYPDTDSPPTVIRREWLDELRRDLPEPAWAVEERLRKLGLPEDVVQSLVFSPRRGLFERLVGGKGVEPKLVGVALEQWSRWLQRQGYPVGKLPDDVLEELFTRYCRGEFAREALVPLMRGLARGRRLEELLAERGLGSAIETAQLTDAVAARVAGCKAARAREPESLWRFYMGKVMVDLRGRARGADIAAAVRRSVAGGGPSAARAPRTPRLRGLPPVTQGSRWAVRGR